MPGSVLPLNVPMLRRGLHRLLAGRAVDLKSLATRSWELCPAEACRNPPALYPPDHLARIRKLSPWQSWDREKPLIEGGVGQHAASEGHLLQNVWLSGAHLYKGAGRLQPGYGPERLWHPGRGSCQHLTEARLVTSRSGSHFFGTLLLDDFPLALLEPDGPPPLTMVSKHYEHEAGYRELCAVPVPEPVQHAFIERLVIYTDYAQNSLKAARYQQLRAALRQHLTAPADQPCIFLRRGAAGMPRVLTNAAALEAQLQTLGFDILDTDHMSAAEIAQRSLNARLVVSVEGSHLSHVIYSAAENATLLVLQPPDRFAMPYKEYTDRMGMGFAFLVGLPTAEGFEVPVHEVEAMLEEIARRPPGANGSG